MAGVAVGAACYSGAAEAAAAYCASVGGSVAGGVASCSGASITGRSVSWTLHVDGPSGRTSRQVVSELQECEPYDWSFWSPVLAAWFLAMVLVVCVRMIKRPFNRDTL